MLKSKIPMVRGGALKEFDAEFKFAKIQNSHVEGGLTEFDAEFKFAKIQNSYVGGGEGSWNLMQSSNLLKFKIPMLRVGGGGGLQNLMLSSNLLKSKIPMLGGGGGLAEFDAEFKFAKIQNPHFHEPPPHPHTHFQLVFDHRR